MTSHRALIGLVSLLALAALATAGPAAAATFSVDSTADIGDANTGNPACATAGAACTLRAAIDQANASAGPDVISLPAGTYQLTGAAGDDANSSGDLDIEDAGSASTTITGAGARSATIVGTGSDRVIELHEGTVSISGVTVTGGGGVDEGGGIFADGTINLSNSSVAGNRADDDASSFSGEGGGIFLNDSANLTNVTISGNVAARSATSPFGAEGGGLFDNGSPPTTLVNVTISGNQIEGTAGEGAGVFYNADPNTATYTNVTIAGNSAPADTDGGGIFLNDELTMKNTIVALNRVGGSPSNCSLNDTLHSAGHNLAEGTDCSFGAAGDLQNSNPLLGALANNGGQVDTLGLPDGSPAIDAGDGAGCPATDARGIARPQGPACDIGAFEGGNSLAPTPGPAPKAKCKKKKHKKHAAAAKKCKKKKGKRKR
jgi:CSLREA domain-containing protein